MYLSIAGIFSVDSHEIDIFEGQRGRLAEMAQLNVLLYAAPLDASRPEMACCG